MYKRLQRAVSYVAAFGALHDSLWTAAEGLSSGSGDKTNPIQTIVVLLKRMQDASARDAKDAAEIYDQEETACGIQTVELKNTIDNGSRALSLAEAKVNYLLSQLAYRFG